MPQVGSKKFPYTSAGVQQAQKHARATGQKVNMAGYKKGGTKKKYKAGGKVKKKNCLLYTSPSPRDRQKSRMPSSA